MDRYGIPRWLAGVVAGLGLVALAKAGPGRTNEFVVAADGSGDFKSVQEAIMAVPVSSSTGRWWTLRIKPGVYRELVYIQRERGFLRLLGQDAENTVITHDLHANLPGRDGKPIGTFRTPSVFIDADNVVAENLTFENAAGPVAQALAIRLDGDRLVFRRCRFLGWQDTILANRGRHYFEDCYITGHVDFIFGAATAWFERSHIHCRTNGYITAPSTPQGQPFGFVFSHCRITGEPGAKTFLGRPWRPFGSAVFLNTEMSKVVRPEGWDNWRNPENEKTARFAEYNSTGPGANPQARVRWARQLSADEARRITRDVVLGGADNWRP